MNAMLTLTLAATLAVATAEAGHASEPQATAPAADRRYVVYVDGMT
jgi:hypothetical protein